MPCSAWAGSTPARGDAEFSASAASARTLPMRLPHLAVLAAFASCSAAPADPAPGPRQVELKGTIAWEAHLDRPHAVHTVEALLRLSIDGRRARLELHENATGTNPALTVMVRDDDGAYWLRQPGRTRFSRDDGASERLLRLLLAVLGAPAAAGRIAWQHPRLGDVVDAAAFDQDGAGARLHVIWHRATDQAEMWLCQPTNWSEAQPIAALAKDDVDPAPSPPRAAAPRFQTLAPGVHAITLPDADTRALAIEFADHLVLCETSLDNPTGERLLAALDQHLPGKPVRYVLFGHYHPHYTGGLRPVMARGATVMAPPLGAAFAKEIAARPFRSPPDALATSGRTPVVESFTGERTFRDDGNELVAIDIGEDSHHTAEYVVFWLPRQQLLFQGDLGWFQGTVGTRTGGARARGLVKAIDDRGLPVVTLVQAWPTLGAPTLPLAELRALLAK